MGLHEETSISSTCIVCLKIKYDLFFKTNPKILNVTMTSDRYTCTVFSFVEGPIYYPHEIVLYMYSLHCICTINVSLPIFSCLGQI